MKSKTFSATEPVLTNAISKVDEMINKFLEEDSVIPVGMAAAIGNVPVPANPKINHSSYAVTILYEPK